MNTNILDISSLLGLSGVVVLSFNFLLGLIVSTSYRKSVYWKKLPAFIKKISILKVHNRTAYVALLLIFLHPFVLLADSSTKFFLEDILIPFHTSYQTFWVALGIISLYAVIIVIITTQKFIKRKLEFSLWKNIHFISYLTAVLMCLHGIFLDPALKNRSPDFFDGEKIVSEACLLLLLIAVAMRTRYYFQKMPT